MFVDGSRLQVLKLRQRQEHGDGAHSATEWTGGAVSSGRLSTGRHQNTGLELFFGLNSVFKSSVFFNVVLQIIFSLSLFTNIEVFHVLYQIKNIFYKININSTLCKI